MSEFGRVITDFMNFQPRRLQQPISQQEFDHWLREFTFDAMRGLRYGQSFCNWFDITDNRLFYERDQEKCDRLIRAEYIKQHD